MATDFTYIVKSPGGMHVAGFMSNDDARHMARRITRQVPDEVYRVVGQNLVWRYRNGREVPRTADGRAEEAD